ncbi:YqiA/YcfP family alpha/beta fold hydrolase [Arcobacter sp.]|uniref:YqiA/YcfP family alpha/beta fold hydrolase n=1 Tax=Arcobacter sp. TaxID=1872629 RepID=UPI003D10422B
MIIYIHGFASSGLGGKAALFKEYYNEELISPSLSYVPSLAIDTLEQLIESYISLEEEVYLVGSSLGGYYAIYLANKYNLKAVLINPAVYAYETLDKIGTATNYYDYSSFEVIKEHLTYLKSIEVNEIKNQSNFMVLLQEDDEVLDFNDAVEKLPESELIIEQGGSHSFDEVERYFRKITTFFR